MTAIHGLLGCAEWTGRAALDIARRGRRRAGGANGSWPRAPIPPRMSRSVPLAKAWMTRCVCLYQNGERVRPSNGYPMRLLLPGFEGNMNVKWLRRIKLVDAPVMTKDETSKYTVLLQGRQSLAVRVPDGGEVDHHPAVARAHAEGAGLLRDFRAWPGRATAASGRSRSRPTAARAGRRGLQEPMLPKALTRFRAAWQWNGGRRCCKAAPPTRPAWCSRRARSSRPSAACAASITTTRSQAGGIDEKGEATNVYA